MKRVHLLKLYVQDMNPMFFKIYILSTLRLMVSKWWLSLIKIFSLTTGILSFLLIWLFYIDYHYFFDEQSAFFKSCSMENAVILGFIVSGTAIIYFLIMKSQRHLRNKELFLKKYYGETRKGVIIMLMIETSIFIIISFLLSLALIDQVTPMLNHITEKDVSLHQADLLLSFLIMIIFLGALGLIVGIFPSLWYSKSRAIDFLKELPK